MQFYVIWDCLVFQPRQSASGLGRSQKNPKEAWYAQLWAGIVQPFQHLRANLRRRRILHRGRPLSREISRLKIFDIENFKTSQPGGHCDHRSADEWRTGTEPFYRHVEMACLCTDVALPGSQAIIFPRCRGFRSGRQTGPAGFGP